MVNLQNMFFVTVIFCLGLFSHACGIKNGNSEAPQSHAVPADRMEKLKQAFERGKYACFFDLFANTYTELDGFYGFDDDTGKHPLYDLAETHIPYLFAHQETVGPEVFAEKLYGIAKGGVWDADGIGIFQHHLSESIINEPAVFLKILTTKPDAEARAFWYFVLDGPVPRKKDFEAIYEKINPMDKRQSRLLEETFKNTLREF